MINSKMIFRILGFSASDRNSNAVMLWSGFSFYKEE